MELSEMDKAALRAQNEAIGGVLLPPGYRSPRRPRPEPVTVTITLPKPMTGKEWQLLRALQPGRRRTPADLVAEGRLPRGSSLPGVHQTGASLVRKGWATRHRPGGYHPLVSYTRTAAGTKALEEIARQGARDAAVTVRASVRQYVRTTGRQR
jgi:hypothetical protein